MILLDTHIWIWWINQDASLSPHERELLVFNEQAGLGVSVISCWEVAMLVRKQRISLNIPVDQWVREALLYRGIRLFRLTPSVAVASTQLPGEFHADPADRIIVATSMARKAPLMTRDARIRSYPHVSTI